MRKILVTGASGHLGANVVRRLLVDGEAVRVLEAPGRDTGAFDGIDVERVGGDLRDQDAISAAVRGCTHIYHCAGIVSTFEGSAAHRHTIYETNVLGTIHILRAAARHNVDKVVVTGSLSATGMEPGCPSREDMPFYPFDRPLPYGVTKHLVEHECLRAHADGLNVVVATPCAIVGPHDYVPSRMGQALIDFAHGRLRAYTPGGFSFISSLDIAEGHVLAMRKGRSGQKYLFSTAFMSMDALMLLFQELTGQPLPRLRLPPFLMSALAQITDKTLYRVLPNAPRRFTPAAVRFLQMQRLVDHSKAKQELGYEPTSLPQAFRAAYEDFVRRGVIKPVARGLG